MMNLIALLSFVGLVASCDSSLTVHTSEVPASLSDGKIEGELESPLAKAVKLNAVDCVDPQLSKVPTTVALISRPQYRKWHDDRGGGLGMGAGEVHVDCLNDGAVGCVTTATYKSANTGASLQWIG